ncbi:MAG: hypothetical protein IT258_14045 [Saprospiraceae bacterium]|nr:hypothetical protein [Saprospiraceae bacterium]
MHLFLYQSMHLARDFHGSPFWGPALSYASPVVGGRRYRVLRKGTKLSIQRLWGDIFELHIIPYYQPYLIAEGSMEYMEGHAHLSLTIRPGDYLLFVSWGVVVLGIALCGYFLFENWILSLFALCFFIIGFLFQRWLIRHALRAFLAELTHDMERFKVREA